MSYYGYYATMNNLDGDYVEQGVVYAKDYGEAEKKVKDFYYRDDVKKLEIWFETIDDVLIIEGE